VVVVHLQKYVAVAGEARKNTKEESSKVLIPFDSIILQILL
jgi:hypothetical protein